MKSVKQIFEEQSSKHKKEKIIRELSGEKIKCHECGKTLSQSDIEHLEALEEMEEELCQECMWNNCKEERPKLKDIDTPPGIHERFEWGDVDV